MINELPLYPVDRPAGAPAAVDFGRTECFYTCLRSLTQFLNNFYTFTPEEMACLPMQLRMFPHRCMHILYRLALMDDPAWERAAVLASVDVLASMERLADIYAAVPGAIGLETDGTDMYSRVASVMRATVPIWRKALEEAGVLVGGMAGADVVGMQDFPAIDLSFGGWLNDSLPPFNLF